MNNEEFLNIVSKLVIAENNKRGKPLFPSVVIAQAICETGWGRSQIMMKANAIFGIKASKNWKGKVYNAKTKECYDGITFTNITDSFRAYDSLYDSVKDYFNLITNSERYKKACFTNSPKECIEEIKNGGYATDPKYVTIIMSIINANNLTKYDNVENVDNSVDKFEVGKVYTTLVDLHIRSGAGTNFRIKKYYELTENAKKNSYIQAKAVLKKGTRVTCLKVVKENLNTWLLIPSGYVCAIYNGKEYIK